MAEGRTYMCQGLGSERQGQGQGLTSLVVEDVKRQQVDSACIGQDGQIACAVGGHGTTVLSQSAGVERAGEDVGMRATPSAAAAAAAAAESNHHRRCRRQTNDGCGCGGGV